MSSHPVTNFEIQKYYKNRPKFNGLYSWNAFSKLKDKIYVINLSECKSIGAPCITLYVNGNNIMYFERSGIEHIPKEMIKKVMGKKNILTNIYRIQAFNSIICEYFPIGFIEFMLKGKSLLDYVNSFFSNKSEKCDKIILIFFSIIK